MQFDNHDLNMKRLKAITILIIVALAAFTFISCAGLKKSKGSIESKGIAETTLTENNSKKTDFFDRSHIDRNDLSLSLEPVDPTKEMSVRNEGNTTYYSNAKPKYNRSNTQTKKNTGGTIDEAKNKNSKSLEENTEKQTWYEKLKVSTPWYIFLFGFLFLVVFVFQVMIFIWLRKAQKILTQKILEHV